MAFVKGSLESVFCFLRIPYTLECKPFGECLSWGWDCDYSPHQNRCTYTWYLKIFTTLKFFCVKILYFPNVEQKKTAAKYNSATVFLSTLHDRVVISKYDTEEEDTYFNQK